MTLETKAALLTIQELEADGNVVETKFARKPHPCKQCKLPILKGEEYYCVYVGKGLASLKYPNRYHLGCLSDEKEEKK